MSQPAPGLRGALGREVDVAGMAKSAGAWLVDWRFALTVGVGVLLRLRLYLDARSYWMDEGRLAANIGHRTASGLFSLYEHNQLAPPGFLVLEVGVARLFGTGPLALRLIPFLCGVAALFVFAALARRVLGVWGAWTAVALFAVSNDLVYYSAELKPYMTDVLAAAGLVLAGVLALESRPGPRGWALLAALGVAAVWVSFPAALVLAAVGSTLALASLARGDRRGAGLAVLTAAAWVASFVASFALAERMLGSDGRRAMMVFWDFAFPPLPARAWSSLSWPFRRVAYLFTNPLDFHGPLGPWLSRLPAWAAAALGVGALARRDPAKLALAVGPVLVALGAAAARAYPMHGRLALYLIPAVLLVVGAGVDVVFHAVRPGWVRTLLLAWVLAFPASRAVVHFSYPAHGTVHDMIGDLQPQMLAGRRGWF